MLHKSLEQDRTDVKTCPYYSLVLTSYMVFFYHQTGHRSDIKQL